MDTPFPAYRGDEPYVFVCYAHDDSDLVYPEIQWLHDQGINVWYDEGISPGSTWRDEVALALTQCNILLYFVTPRSVASTNCLNEVNFCLSRERKILSVHLEKTELPIGLELSLSAMQAIVRTDHTVEGYQTKLSDSLQSLLPEPIAIPGNKLTETKTDEKSIAILPLVNRSNDPDNEYLCDGISEELIGGLSSVEGLRVASQLSSFALKSQNLDAHQMGEKLDVGHILSGSVQKSGSRVRISILLSQVKDGSSLWSKRYNRELDDIFELQEDVARQVIDALKVALGADQSVQLVDVGTRNVRAYDAFLLGMHEYRKQTRGSLAQAIINLQQAVQLDPGFGRAFWWLSRCYWILLITFGLPREEMTPKAEEALNSAQAAGFVPPIPWTYARSQIHPEIRRDQRTLALEACEQIRRPDPEGLNGYLQLGNSLTAAGFFHAALDFSEYDLDGLQHDASEAVLPWRGYLLSQLGRFDRAIDLWTESIAAQPDDPIAIGERAMLYSRTGQYEKAEQDLVVLSKVFPRNFPQFYHLYWRRELDAAKAYFNWLESRKNLPLVYKYWGCFLLGDIEGGISYVEEGVNRVADPVFLHLQVVRVLPQSISREVEQHPRFQSILKQFGIDDTWRDELMDMANDLTDITGIYVQLDGDY